MKRSTALPLAAGCAAVLAVCALAWPAERGALLAAWLAAWWFCIGAAMGGLANVWLHNLTGGAWGEAIRAPLLRGRRIVWLGALLFLPVLAGVHILYPWAAQAGQGMARWNAEFSAPGFKNAWLQPHWFVARSLIYLAVWSLLAWLSGLRRFERGRGFGALALIVYGFTVSLAAVDWIMSLMPQWYSSVFGWLVGTGQMLAGMALAILLATRARPAPPPTVLADLGNLLLMYVLTWAYLAFTQFLIIWAEDLPHEIAWYLPRMQAGWLVLGWMLVLFHFALPLLILLSRHAKRSARLLGWLAAGLLAMRLVDAWWLVLPSLRPTAGSWPWSAPLAALALGAFMLSLLTAPPEKRHG